MNARASRAKNDNIGGSIMKKSGILVATLVAMSALSSGAATGLDYKAGSLEVDSPWSRAVPKGAKVAAGYMTIKNTGTEPDRLVGGSTPVAGGFTVHEMTMDNGVMKMRPLPSGLEIKPGETVELKPGSFHIMMTDLKGLIQRGKPFKATLKFEKAGDVDVDFAVEAAGATSAAASAPDAHHDMHHH
jgi:periplasmic copper chaperone A